MAIQKISGKAVQCTIGGNRCYHVKIAVKPEKEMADSTDASNYDTDTELVWKSQIPVSAQLKLEIEGKYDRSTTGTATFAKTMYSAKDAAGAPLAVVVKYNATDTAISGNFDVTEFQSELPLQDLVSFTATLSSNGPATYNPTGGS